jgi:catechol 2,3-dioxygenase-like lactoylglutathione lyase family enzyme
MQLGGTRALDHFVIAVRDLERSGAAWTAMGFRVLPKMRHVTAGCANRVVQFGRTYLELLGDIELMLEMYRGHYLGRFAYGEGLANICFTADDLDADRAAVEAEGVRCGPVTSARRAVVMPDGASEDTDSDFFYPWRDGRPYMSPFLAVHRKPEIIFVPEYAVHPNTARDVVGIICQSVDPGADAAFFAMMAGAEARAIDGGMRVALSQGDVVDILTPAALRTRFGSMLPSGIADAPGIGVGLTIRVGSLAACRAALGVEAATVDGALVVPAAAACGAFVRFVEG